MGIYAERHELLRVVLFFSQGLDGGLLAIASDPFDRAEWLEAARIAPSIKSDFYTVLSSRDCLPEIESALRSDPNLRQCFRG